MTTDNPAAVPDDLPVATGWTGITVFDLDALAEDVAHVLNDPAPDPTAGWWARKADALLAEVAALRQQVAEVQAERREAEYHIQQITEARDRAERTAEAAEPKVAALTAQRDRWEETAGEMTASYLNANAEVTALRAICDAKEPHRTAALAEQCATEWRARAEAAEQTVAALTAERDYLRDELSATRVTLVNTGTERNTAKAEVAAQARVIEQVRALADEWEANYDRWKGIHDGPRVAIFRAHATRLRAALAAAPTPPAEAEGAPTKSSGEPVNLLAALQRSVTAAKASRTPPTTDAQEAQS